MKDKIIRENVIKVNQDKLDSHHDFRKSIHKAMDKYAEQKTDNWISTKERLPEFDELVIVYCEIYGRYTTTYEQIMDTGYGNWRFVTGELGGLPPTHWQPLPEPPKK